MSTESWRKTFTYGSETVFPGLLLYKDLHNRVPHTEIISSLPLQMTLYFNVVFFPVWLVTTVVMTAHKLECLSNLYQFIAVTVITAVTIIEILRIYLGYMGNLAEKIPEVAGFWMLSILLQLPLQTFLTASSHLSLSALEYTVQGVVMILLLSQLATGFLALRNAARHQAHRFQMMQFNDSQGRVNQGFLNDSDTNKTQ